MISRANFFAMIGLLVLTALSFADAGDKPTVDPSPAPANTAPANKNAPAGEPPGKATAEQPAGEPASKDAASKESATKQPATKQPATKQGEDRKFTRIARDESGKPISLDTGIARYTRSAPGEEPITVELVGAVHVGEKSYYDALNEQFTKYDAVLFELVAPPNTKIPKGGGPRSGNPVSALQTGLKSVLGLEFQLEQVDYTQPNFVHADMSPEEFSAKMKEKNESFWTMFLKMMGQGMAQQSNAASGASELSMLTAIFSKNREIKLKQTMAIQMENMDGAIEALEGPDGSTILTERNKKAMEVLRRELQAGKKNLGIFYGAAHLPDMHRRLESEFGMKFVDLRWVPAWDLKIPESTRTNRKRSKTSGEDAPESKPESKSDRKGENGDSSDDKN